MSRRRDYVVTFTAAEQAELAELPPDEKPLEADEVAGRTLVSLISPGTEIAGSYVEGKFPSQPGYAAVFEVGDVGSGVDDLKAGDRVLASGPQGIGGHRSRQRCPRQAAVPVPDGLDPAVAAHARLMGVSMSTLTTTTARPPEKVLVLGLGPVGNFAAQIFQACGYEVMAVDPLEPRCRLAQNMGVKDVREAVPLDDKAAMEGIALALECSGHEQAAFDACRAVRKRGEVVQIGVPRVRHTELYAHDLLKAVYRRYVVLRIGWEWEIPRYGAEFRTGSVFGNLAAAARWLAEGRVRADGLYRTASPRDAQQVYQDLLHRRGDGLTVAFDWSKVS